MARPNKQGVDYFPLDVHLDDKFKFIEIKFGLEGFAIVIKLMQRIYSQGYWCNWTEDELLLFSDEIRSDCEKVQQVVNECLERDILNKELYEKYNILTSRGIQKRYKEIVKRRKGVEVIEEYLLVDNNFGVNDDINSPSCKHDDDINQTSCNHDGDINQQSKVKKSKVNNKSSTPDGDDEKNPPTNKELIAELVQRYRGLDGVKARQGDYPFIGRLYNQYGYDRVYTAIDSLGLQLLTDPIENTLTYLKGILQNDVRPFRKQKKTPPKNETREEMRLRLLKEAAGNTKLVL